ncbi:MAG TPA: hypothetical protein PKE26_16065 [Kiritimatiellia bacterium]|nr:hypothetical protein [Kiritimatiellia bacterium]HMP00612.1 hypothetical protein [Kiritimatiellia bacterium]
MITGTDTYVTLNSVNRGCAPWRIKTAIAFTNREQALAFKH